MCQITIWYSISIIILTLAFLNMSLDHIKVHINYILWRGCVEKPGLFESETAAVTSNLHRSLPFSFFCSHNLVTMPMLTQWRTHQNIMRNNIQTLPYEICEKVSELKNDRLQPWLNHVCYLYVPLNCLVVQICLHSLGSWWWKWCRLDLERFPSPQT